MLLSIRNVAFLVQFMDFSMALGIVLMSNCGKDTCCCDREDSETSFEDKCSNSVSICIYRTDSCQEHKLCLMFLAESCSAPSTVGIPHRRV